MNEQTICLLFQQAAKFKYNPFLQRPMQVYKRWAFLCPEGMFLRKFCLEMEVHCNKMKNFLYMYFRSFLVMFFIYHLPGSFVAAGISITF